ncbi:S1 family peptidase [Herbidospora daliensis]|uniref:S1 family peptidase n=1 Tax=Herbidospora daliensis TaxID=295585 RepID=UPI0007822FBC|nr:serine protease [Herbidospora daliensis]
MIGKLLTLAALAAAAGCGQEAPQPTQAAPVSASASMPPEIAAQRPIVVRVRAATPSCEKDTAHGTGFAYAPERVLTVAHVVAGSRGPVQVLGSDGARHEGAVVLFDVDRDIAVLRVPGLRAGTLRFGPIGHDERATFAGYPKDRDLVVRSGGVRRATLAVTNDIYNEREVLKEVFIVRAAVDPGVAGAPLFRPDGTVSGMIFAADTGEAERGYAVTAKMFGHLATKARAANAAVSTQGCV